MVIQEPNLGPHRGGVLGREGTGQKASSSVWKFEGRKKKKKLHQSHVPWSACGAGGLKGGPRGGLEWQAVKGPGA